MVARGPLEGFAFNLAAYELERHYVTDKKYPPAIASSPCRECEFRATPPERLRGMRDGFRECWKEAAGWRDEDFEEPNVLQLSGRVCNPSRAELIKDGHLKLADLDPATFSPPIDDDMELSSSDVRQRLQVEAARSGDYAPMFRSRVFLRHLRSWEPHA